MTAAVLLYEGRTITEVAEIATRLANVDVDVQFVARVAEELRDQSGLRMLPDRALEEVDATALSVVVVPGGNPDPVIDDPVVLSWLRRADEAGVLVGAICAGVPLVASAGLVTGASDHAQLPVAVGSGRVGRCGRASVGRCGGGSGPEGRGRSRRGT